MKSFDELEQKWIMVHTKLLFHNHGMARSPLRAARGSNQTRTAASLYYSTNPLIH